MTSYLLLWNPAQWAHSNILRMTQDLRQTGIAKEPWRFMAHNKGRAGDDVFLFKTGDPPRGIFGHGHLVGTSFEGRGSDDKTHWMFNVHFDQLADPYVGFLIPEAQLKDIPGWSVPRGSGNTPLDVGVAQQILDLITPTGDILTEKAQKKFNEQINALTETERTQIVQQRVGQDIFRKSLLSFWSGKCCISGLAQPELLRASHAKDWSKCADRRERLDVYNGLLLAAHLDAAFDAGLIAVNQNGIVQISQKLNSDAIKLLGLDKPVKVSGLTPAHHPYLDWHLRHKFQRA
jgi:hypothetical protein